MFRAGLKHSLVDSKWPAFEAAFRGFVPGAVLAMSDEAVEALMNDRGLIRHWGKLRSVRANAAVLDAISREHGGFGRFLAGWPAEQTIELWAELADASSRWAANPDRASCVWPDATPSSCRPP